MKYLNPKLQGLSVDILDVKTLSGKLQKNKSRNIVSNVKLIRLRCFGKVGNDQIKKADRRRDRNPITIEKGLLSVKQSR